MEFYEKHLAHLFENATGIELFWALITYLGVFLMVSFVIELLGDQRFNEANKVNGARRIVAAFALRRQALKIVGAVCLAIPATITVFNPNPVPDDLRALNLISLSIVPLILVLINIVDRMERTALDDYYDHQTDNEMRQETEDAITQRGQT